MDADQEEDISTFGIDTDQTAFDEEYADKAYENQNEWHPLFYSKDFWKEHPDKVVDAYRLQERTLKSLAKKAVILRQMFYKRAEGVDDSNQFNMLDGQEHSSYHGKQIRKRGTSRCNK